jgi:hypothetical protein
MNIDAYMKRYASHQSRWQKQLSKWQDKASECENTSFALTKRQEIGLSKKPTYDAPWEGSSPYNIRAQPYHFKPLLQPLAG